MATPNPHFYLWLTIKNVRIVALPNLDSINAFVLLGHFNSHIHELGRIPYLVSHTDESVTFINRRSALKRTKSTAVQLGAKIKNLDQFEPSCPACGSQTVFSPREGLYCCYNCKEQGQPSHFWTGGIDLTYINYYAKRIENDAIPST